jgi:hypothetical protein
MPKKDYKTTTLGKEEYELAEKLARKDNRSVKGMVEVLIIRQAKKEGII